MKGEDSRFEEPEPVHANQDVSVCVNLEQVPVQRIEPQAPKNHEYQNYQAACNVLSCSSKHKLKYL